MNTIQHIFKLLLVYVILGVSLSYSQLQVVSEGAQETKETQKKSASAPVLRKRTPTLAIMPLSNTNPSARKVGYGASIASMLQTQIRNETNFLVLERSQLSQILDEKALSGMGLSESERMNLAKLHSVEVLLMGEVAELGGLIQVDIRLVSVKTGKVVVAEYVEVSQLSALRAKISELAKVIELKYLRQWIGSLEIAVAPVEGEVYLDGSFIGKASQGKVLKLEKLLEGDYHLRVIAGGYKQYEETLRIFAKTHLKKSIPLQSLPGILKVESDPSGAEVYMNDRKIGVTPLSIPDLEKGRYALKIQAPQYLNWKKYIKIQPGNTSEVNAQLTVIPGSLYFQTEPAGASAFINSKYVGKTPFLLENISPANYSIQLDLDGYQSVTQDIQVRPGERHQVPATLVKQTGKLTLINDLEGCKAQIYRDTLLLEELDLPIHKKDFEIGEYRVEIHRPKYFPVVRNISILPQEESRIQVHMKKKPGTLKIEQERLHAADLYYDGDYQGKVSERSSILKEGKYEVVVDDFFNTQSHEVEIIADEETLIELKQEDKSPDKVIIPLVTSVFVFLLFLI